MINWDVIAAVFAQENYEEVRHLLEQLPPQDPWVILYKGRLSEIDHNSEAAAAAYKQLLKTDNGPRISREARQGLQRLKDAERAQQQQAIAVASQEFVPGEFGLLILEAIPPEAKADAAKAFAQIMHIDPYSARMTIPSLGWRLYRWGPIAEMKVYAQMLQEQGIPTFWLALTKIQTLQVLRVAYFESATETVVAHTTTETHSATPFTFTWAEVTQRVEGLVPIFEEVVDLDNRGRMQRKEKIQDYAQFCDLHLPGKNCILRLYDTAYQFHQGMPLPSQNHLPQPGQGTSWLNWKSLQTFLNQSLANVPVWTNFTPFAESAVEQTELLDLIDPQINLFRRTDSYWDQTFHLYSCLAYWKNL